MRSHVTAIISTIRNITCSIGVRASGWFSIPLSTTKTKTESPAVTVNGRLNNHKWIGFFDKRSPVNVAIADIIIRIAGMYESPKYSVIAFITADPLGTSKVDTHQMDTYSDHNVSILKRNEKNFLIKSASAWYNKFNFNCSIITHNRCFVKYQFIYIRKRFDLTTRSLTFCMDEARN